MGHRWIVDVLADLRTYAYMNNLHVLAQELDACARVALGETSRESGASPIGVMNDAAGDRELSGTGGKGQWTR
jgi:hypothetical protein